MKTQTSPYACHLFVCVKTRQGDRTSCGDGDNPDLKAQLKAEIKTRGWKGVVRVSDSGCLGLCDSDPNILLYPQGIWFSEVTKNDLPEILQTLESFIP